MRSATRTFAAVFGLGVVALLCIGLVERQSEAFTLGVQPVTALYLSDGSTLCQGPIEVPTDFSGLRLTVAAAVVSSPPARVEVLDANSGERLARGKLRGGYPSDTTEAPVELGPVPAGKRIRVCLHGSGRGGLLVFGNASAAVRGSGVTLNGRPRERDIDIVFLREDSASVLSLVGEMVPRAALFHGGWVGSWTIWALMALLLTAFPALLALALRRAGEPAEDQPTASASE